MVVPSLWRDILHTIFNQVRGSHQARSIPSVISSYNGPGGVAVTPHYLATEAAVRAMADGGNAVDAMVAANAVLGMVLPTTCGIGGDLRSEEHTS